MKNSSYWFASYYAVLADPCCLILALSYKLTEAGLTTVWLTLPGIDRRYQLGWPIYTQLRRLLLKEEVVYCQIHVYIHDEHHHEHYALCICFRFRFSFNHCLVNLTRHRPPLSVGMAQIYTIETAALRGSCLLSYTCIYSWWTSWWALCTVHLLSF